MLSGELEACVSVAVYNDGVGCLGAVVAWHARDLVVGAELVVREYDAAECDCAAEYNEAEDVAVCSDVCT